MKLASRVTRSMIASGCVAVALGLAGCERAPKPEAAAPAVVTPAPAPVAPVGSPRWIAGQYASPTGMPDRERWTTGELAAADAATPLLCDTKLGMRVRGIRTVQAADSLAIEAVTLRLADGAVTDHYLYFVPEDASWKLAAVRTLTWPATMMELARSYGALRSRPADMQAVYDNLRLRLASDDSLCAYLHEFRGELDALAQISSEPGFPPRLRLDEPHDAVSEPRVAGALSLLRRLHLSAVACPSEWPGFVFVAAGGDVGPDVGFVHVPDGQQPPPMSPDGWMLVQPIEGGWHLYKVD